MMKRFIAQSYLWLLLTLLYAPIIIIAIFSFTEAKVLGNWTGFSTKLYTSLFQSGAHHSLVSAIENTLIIALVSAAVSTVLGSIAAIGIDRLRGHKRSVLNTLNNIPMLNPDIITGISLFLLFVSLG
ncbi:MAG: ABC transporter permease, partial [Alistipes sp.]|nr:ABC transporter permease [Alistipes sp.]